MATTEPAYLGVDDCGDQVWQLPNGRWVWGEDVADATRMGEIRSFTPERYIDKYGWPSLVPYGRTVLPVIERIEYDPDWLYAADPNCDHYVYSAWSGVKCARCPGWFCY